MHHEVGSASFGPKNDEASPWLNAFALRFICRPYFLFIVVNGIVSLYVISCTVSNYC